MIGLAHGYKIKVIIGDITVIDISYHFVITKHHPNPSEGFRAMLGRSESVEGNHYPTSNIGELVHFSNV